MVGFYLCLRTNSSAWGQTPRIASLHALRFAWTSETHGGSCATSAMVMVSSHQKATVANWLTVGELFLIMLQNGYQPLLTGNGRNVTTGMNFNYYFFSYLILFVVVVVASIVAVVHLNG